MLHDIQYLQLAGMDPTVSDDLAVQNAPYSIPGVALKVGLTLRKIAGISFNDKLPSLTNEETRLLGDDLMHRIKTSEKWQRFYESHDIDLSNYQSTFT